MNKKQNPSYTKVKFSHPTWWLFIMAFRYAIHRHNAIGDIEAELFDNIDLFDKQIQEDYLNKMVSDSAQAISMDVLKYRDDDFMFPGDIAKKYDFMERCVGELRQRGLRLNCFAIDCRERGLELYSRFKKGERFHEQ